MNLGSQNLQIIQRQYRNKKLLEIGLYEVDELQNSEAREKEKN